ncbi:hypothetical protein AaE_003850 [Aphanomyces astaci]|uniref:Uncharacterized protein n=1 Tax=Aphanomyces astaci TaxID=112090 RepID=A0A6A5AR96_APHAT|nr:hypothetical protein AaE_003850 [Aphanomyces astaci]
MKDELPHKQIIVFEAQYHLASQSEFSTALAPDMSDTIVERYSNSSSSVGKLVAVLRWANVAANRGTLKADLQLCWATKLFHRGPPLLEDGEDLHGFPDVVPPSWVRWLQEHLQWQGMHSEPLASSVDLSFAQAIQPPHPDGDPFYVFDKTAKRLRAHLAIGTAECQKQWQLQRTFPRPLVLVLWFGLYGVQLHRQQQRT